MFAAKIITPTCDECKICLNGRSLGNHDQNTMENTLYFEVVGKTAL